MEYFPGNPFALVFEYLSKWSGGCFEDYSSGVGGFCLLETSDVKTAKTSACTVTITETSTGITANTTLGNGSIGCIWDMSDLVNGKVTDYKLKANTNRSMQTYRVSSANLKLLKEQWGTAAAFDSDTNIKDGRFYRDFIKGNLVDEASTIEWLDYPHCTLQGTVWTCQMFLPKVDKQKDGYPAFRAPGVIVGHVIHAGIPAVELLSYYKTKDLIRDIKGNFAGATSTTVYVASTIAALSVLMF